MLDVFVSALTALAVKDQCVRFVSPAFALLHKGKLFFRSQRVVVYLIASEKLLLRKMRSHPVKVVGCRVAQYIFLNKYGETDLAFVSKF